MFMSYQFEDEAKKKFQRVQVFNTVVLPMVCRKLYFDELKILRLVCYTWNEIVTSQWNWQDSKGKFGRKFLKSLKNLDFDRIPRWETIEFDRFNITKTRNMFHSYWTNYAQYHVTTIELKMVRADCTDLILFLNKCPALVNLTIYRVKFRAEILQRQVGFDNDEDEDEELMKKKYSVQCRHRELFPDYRPQDLGVCVQPITSISFQEQDVIPLCLLDWLLLRSHGKLKRFQFINAKLPRLERETFIPTSLNVETKLRDLILANVDSIEYFECTQNTNGDRLIGSLGRGIGLKELILSQYHPPNWYERFVANQLLDWTPLSLSFRGYYTFLRRPETSKLESLDFELFDKPPAEEFRLMLTALPNLRHLTLRFHASDALPAPNELELNYINMLTNLESLSIYEDTKIFRSLIIPLNFLARLPTTVKTLLLHKKWVVEELIRDYFTSPHSHQLTSLHLSGWIVEITDEIMQLIILNLRSLKHLTIANSQGLHDSGLTGIKAEICERISQSPENFNFDHQDFADEMDGQSLCNLVGLETLNLEGCKHISDISCIFAIAFPKLVELNMSNLSNLTDLGLTWIGRRNLSLKRLVITENPKITKHGIDHLVDSHKNINNIQISKDVLARTGCKKPRPPSPFDKRVVTWTK